MDEVVYVLGTTVPGLVCRSHANRSICAVTPFFNPESGLRVKMCVRNRGFSRIDL